MDDKASFRVLLRSSLVPLLLLALLALAYGVAPSQFPATAPAAGLPFNGVSAVEAGWNSRCAITTGGAAACWGAGIYGQLGNGDIADALYPNEVAGLDQGVVEISAGADFACARVEVSGEVTEVRCWGANWTGNLGNGTTTSSLTPLLALSGHITGLSAGLGHVCAIMDGVVWCWGGNASGELGIGHTGAPVATPVSLDLPAQKVVAGHHHTCALLASGGVRCWGDGRSGQLGDRRAGSMNPVPTDVIGLGGPAVDLSAGGGHTCALLDDGGVQCWGANWWGQLGDGTTTTRHSPVYTHTGPVSAISAGSSHTCAVTTAGAAVCWGDNAGGQLGDGGWRDRSEPAPVLGLERGVLAISAGSAHTCAVLEGGEAACWGAGGPLLGVGSTEPDVGTLQVVLRPATAATLVSRPAE
ncbi:MAG: hypothetical protein GX579_06635 [Chloroflexi bacterium]|jgi:alpha-tubulin suppressor-like RCC1 family protein|nr:hypothetical protein [Chloroflexota bacterium]